MGRPQRLMPRGMGGECCGECRQRRGSGRGNWGRGRRQRLETARDTEKRKSEKRPRWREAPVEILDLRVKIDVSDRSEWI